MASLTIIFPKGNNKIFQSVKRSLKDGATAGFIRAESVHGLKRVQIPINDDLIEEADKRTIFFSVPFSENSENAIREFMISVTQRLNPNDADQIEFIPGD